VLAPTTGLIARPTDGFSATIKIDKKISPFYLIFKYNILYLAFKVICNIIYMKNSGGVKYAL